MVAVKEKLELGEKREKEVSEEIVATDYVEIY